MEKMEEPVMIYRLRNRHFRIWIILALLLPVGFVVSLSAIPEALLGEVISHLRPARSTVIQLSEDSLVMVSTLAEADKPGLEITLKQPLQVPGAHIYLAVNQSEDINLAEFLGQIDSQNAYYFSTDKIVTSDHSLLFYDPINRVIFHKIEF